MSAFDYKQYQILLLFVQQTEEIEEGIIIEIV